MRVSIHYYVIMRRVATDRHMFYARFHRNTNSNSGEISSEMGDGGELRVGWKERSLDSPRDGVEAITRGGCLIVSYSPRHTR